MQEFLPVIFLLEVSTTHYPKDTGERGSTVLCTVIAVDALPVLLMVGPDEDRKLQL